MKIIQIEQNLHRIRKRDIIDTVIKQGGDLPEIRKRVAQESKKSLNPILKRLFSEEFILDHETIELGKELQTLLEKKFPDKKMTVIIGGSFVQGGIFLKNEIVPPNTGQLHHPPDA